MLYPGRADLVCVSAHKETEAVGVELAISLVH